MSSVTRDSWPVPIRANQTIYTFLVEDTSGLLWIAANYTIAAFDPGTSLFVDVRQIDSRPPELDGKAAAVANFDGSWITGLMANLAGDVLLARHNTNAIYRLEKDRIFVHQLLDRPPTGLRLVNGTIQAIARENDNVAVLGMGRTEPLRSLGESGCSLVDGAPGKGALLVVGGQAHLPRLLLAPDDPIVADAKGKRALIGVAQDGAVVLADCANRAVATWSLGMELVYMDGLGGQDRSRPLQNQRFALALALSPAGLAAVSDSTHEVLLLR